MEDTIEKKNFLCGVIEGFYGRPWTTEQRKDLFRKLKKWGMDSYVYAPKDDYKHRAYWRELYTVEEADHLTSLITAAKEHGIVFYYALSPGLDMTYSNQKEIQTLKRKLDQVSHFGCEAFALLFDDIESELSKVDKEVFQTFANAQVSVTNDIYTHLGNPKFLFCPTQYCTSRAVPNIQDSEYLNTLGSKLNHDIDIMWTGNRVISKTITLDAIEEITEVLRRPPVIWDNLHANDYDQKRVFLGPYSGRSPDLIPHLRGVMTNPNCEFHANTVAIHTLAFWSQCNMDSKINSTLSADIKLETENEDGTSIEEVPVDCCLTKKIYHPRIALKNALAEWLPEFSIKKEAWGPITKPQPQVTMVMPIIPIIPSINTCMSLTTTTTTTSTSSKAVAVPEVNTTQLQALADVCSTVSSSVLSPIANPVMNSLVSPTKVVTNDEILNPITNTATCNIELPKKIPISIVPLPIMQTNPVAAETPELNEMLKTESIDAIPEVNVNDSNDTTLIDTDANLETEDKSEEDNINVNLEDDITIDEKLLTNDTVNMDENNLSPLSAGNEPMECSSSLASQTSPKEERKPISEDVVMAETSNIDMNNSMQVESSEPSPLSNTEMKDDDEKSIITMEDLLLLCDLFYLPFEHGGRGLKFLNEFNWLKAHASVLLENDLKKGAGSQPKPEVAEWMTRAEGFAQLCTSVQDLVKKIAQCANKEICHDLFSYIWDIAVALTLLNAFIKWLSLGHFPKNVYSFTQGTYTWFSKGWKEAFMSGEQEPWVFRGGLIADLQRLMPVDSGNDLFLYKLPELPTSECYAMRPLMPIDENEVYRICTNAFLSLHNDYSGDGSITLPDNLKDIIADSIVGNFITLNPELCFVALDSSNSIIGYIAAALDVSVLTRNTEVCWIPDMREKYVLSMVDNSPEFTVSKKLNAILVNMIKTFHNYDYKCPTEVSTSYPAVLTSAVLESILAQDYGIAKRLLTVTLATLRANGCFGVHVRLPVKDTAQTEYYTKMGFTEIYRDVVAKHVYLGRRF